MVMRIVATKNGNASGGAAKTSMQVSLTQDKETEENVIHVNWVAGAPSQQINNNDPRAVISDTHDEPVQNTINVNWVTRKGDVDENMIQVSWTTQKATSLSSSPTQPRIILPQRASVDIESLPSSSSDPSNRSSLSSTQAPLRPYSLLPYAHMRSSPVIQSPESSTRGISGSSSSSSSFMTRSTQTRVSRRDGLKPMTPLIIVTKEKEEEPLPNDNFQSKTLDTKPAQKGEETSTKKTLEGVANELRKRQNSSIKDVQEYLKFYRDDFDKKWIASRQPFSSPTNFDHFLRLRTIGEGSFGRVILVQHKTTKEYVAMKIFDKESVVRREQVKYTINERRLLSAIDFPFITQLKYSFKDNSNVYLGLEYVPGGDLFCHLRRAQKFSEPRARFYAAQIVLIIEYLHSLDIIYRDLKPENLLLDPQGYIKLTDFGLSKRINGRVGRTMTVCGTPDYIAPEVRSNSGHGKGVDWWGLGILIFEMVGGHPPFKGPSPARIEKGIEIERVRFPSHFSDDLREVLRKLLVVDVTRRLGSLKKNKGADEVKRLDWFASTDWVAIFQKKVLAPFVPKLSGLGDTRYFMEFEEKEVRNFERVRFSREFEDF